MLKVDSVVGDFNGYPYRAVTYATQKIIRQSNVTERSLVTKMCIRDSDNSEENLQKFEKSARNMQSLSRYSRSNSINREWVRYVAV